MKRCPQVAIALPTVCKRDKAKRFIAVSQLRRVLAEGKLLDKP
jgi:hypothetical protein